MYPKRPDSPIGEERLSVLTFPGDLLLSHRSAPVDIERLIVVDWERLERIAPLRGIGTTDAALVVDE